MMKNNSDIHKNFNQTYLSSSHDIDEDELKTIFSKNYETTPAQIFIGNALTNLTLNLITSPFVVLYTSLQLSTTKLVKVDNLQQIMQAKITTQQKSKLEQLVRINNQNHYFPASYSNYRQALQGIGEQGLLGFFKGYGIGVFELILKGQFRYYLLQQYNSEKKLQQLAFTSSVAALIDTITNPIMLIQSRLILQNRLPNLSTYRSIVDVIKSCRFTYKGYDAQIAKNMALFLGSIPSIYIEDNRLSLTYLLLSQQVITYPFITIIRRMHCQSKDIFMLKETYSNVIDGFKQCSLLSLYKGFGAFFVANSFLSLVLYSTQLLGENQE